MTRAINRTRPSSRIGGCLVTVIACVSLAASGFPAIAQDAGTGPKTESTATSQRSGTVARAQFTTSVVDREPTDRLSIASSDMGQLYFFSELIGLQGQTITHRWQHFGTTVAEVGFEVRGPRWRVNSSKSLDAGLIGELTVEMVDETEASLGSFSIAIVEPEDGMVPPQATESSVPPQATESMDRAQREATSTPGKAKLAKPANSSMQAIFDSFPSGRYTLVNDSMSLDACPPSGQFDWQRVTGDLWAFILADDRKLTLREATGDSSPLQPLAMNDRGNDDCVLYSGHHFSADASELVIDRQIDCEGESRDVFSMQSLQRERDTVDLTLFDAEKLLCRYRL